MVNFFKPSKEDGTVLHLTKSGKWEKCTIPVGCTRHVDPKSFKNVAFGNFKIVEDEYPEFSKEAWDSRSMVLSADDYNGYDPDEDYDSFDDMKMTVNVAGTKSSEHAAVERKLFKEKNGFMSYMNQVSFNPEHDSCKSYQTACKECAGKHEVKLSELFSLEELSLIVREDSALYDSGRKQMLTTTDVNGEEVKFMSHAVSYILNEFPESEKWNYVPSKSAHQLDLEREGINFSDHSNDDNECRICGQYMYDMYCMECWVPSGYLLEEV